MPSRRNQKAGTNKHPIFKTRLLDTLQTPMLRRAHSRMKMGYTRPEGWHPDRFHCSATSLIYRLIRMLFGTLDCGTRRRPGSTHMSFLQLTSILPALTYPAAICEERDGSVTY